mmetsp:Transcript_21937/g.72439  ORF Transcript_21937/g.72439 Transcript_21937/m.72439 type:complete len:306 (-) Transcript_21937:496-1413(-)
MTIGIRRINLFSALYILVMAGQCLGFSQTSRHLLFGQRRVACTRKPRSRAQVVCSGYNEYMMPQTDLERISPAEILQRLREERKTKRLPFQEWADRLAPRGDMEEFRLNWVGNVDRHQRQLFWKLITMLCHKLAFPLRVARMVHDAIMAVQRSWSMGVEYTKTTLAPALRLTAIKSWQILSRLSRYAVIELQSLLRVCLGFTIHVSCQLVESLSSSLGRTSPKLPNFVQTIFFILAMPRNTQDNVVKLSGRVPRIQTPLTRVDESHNDNNAIEINLKQEKGWIEAKGLPKLMKVWDVLSSTSIII